MRWVSFVGLICLLTGCQPASEPPLHPVSSAELKQIIRQADAPVVLVNMWATWCGPCREEFPDLVRLQRNYAERGLKVLFVSWDTEPRVAQEFLARQGVDFPSYLKAETESDTAFIDAIDPRWSGAFPATLIYDRSRTVRVLWEGKRSYAEFESAVRQVLESKT
ncbi:MAG: TlpA family protein disulfide reductase [Verrucomicrobiae bacterium]|nr:TlpA family protein disulfide reductase [Verrucomicrobiae bacterium]